MKMRAAVVTADSNGNVDLVDKEIRPLQAGEALVEVEYCGVCHTEITKIGRASCRERV